jgi:galactonate dehydratase
MRITKIEDLQCNAGWRDFSFLKISTDEGLVGWSEFMESYGSEGLAGVIRKLSARLIGWDPRPVEKITAYLHGVTRQSVGGIAQQAIAAIENALVDLKAKALGVPVYEMLGGPVRDRLQLYWSHCGTWRISHASHIKEWTGFDPIRSLDDVERAGAEVARRGFKGLKTNIFRFDGPEPYVHMPGFNGPGWPELNISRGLVDGLVAQMTAFRNGAGPKVGLHLDLNFNFKTEGYIRLAQALEPFDLVWLEIDSYDPAALATIRRSARTRVASLESLHGRRQFRPFFEQQSVDVAIIDVAWNGIGVDEDRRDGGCLRGQRGAAQLQRTYRLADERAYVRRNPELPRDGDRYRGCAMEGRSRDAGADDRGRHVRAADRPWLGG